jgi:hypothetical protein
VRSVSASSRGDVPRRVDTPSGWVVPQQVGVVLVLPPLREQKHARHHELHERVGHEVLGAMVEHPREGLRVAEPVCDLAQDEGAGVPRHHARRRLHTHRAVEVWPEQGTVVPFTHLRLRGELFAHRETKFFRLFTPGGMGDLRGGGHTAG